MHILLIEPFASGHRMQYISRIAKEMSRRGWKLTLYTAEASKDHPEIQSLTKEISNLIVIYFHDSVIQKIKKHKNPLITAIKFWKLFKQCVVGKSYDVVFVGTLRHCDKAIAILGSPFGKIPWCGILLDYKLYMDESNIRSSITYKDYINSWFVSRLLKSASLKWVFTIDEILFRFLKKSSNKIIYLIPPINSQRTQSSQVAKEYFGIKNNNKVILVYGALSARKGIDSLIKAVEASKIKNITILLVGKQDDCIKKYLNQQNPLHLIDNMQIICVDEYVSSDVQSKSYCAADVVWVGYRGHETVSDILIYAAASKIPVIACESGWIGWMTRKYNLGICVDIDRIDIVAKAVCQLTGQVFQPAQTAQANDFFSANLNSQFSKTICDLIENDEISKR